MKYYSLDRINSEHADINIIVGQRGNGKTYSVLKQIIETGEDFLYIRRSKEAIKNINGGSIFNPLNKFIPKLYPGYDKISYWNKTYYLTQIDAETEKEKRVKPVGHAISLPDVGNSKGSSAFMNCTTILFDEFIPMAGEHSGLSSQDELKAYKNILSTAIRARDNVKIYLLANTVSKFSPFFTYYNIDINKLKQGEIKTYEYETETGDHLKVAVEYCEYNEDVGAKTGKYFANELKGSKMITKGEWEMEISDDIPVADGELAKERLLCTFKYEDFPVIGIYLRTSTVWHFEKINGLTTKKKHIKSFLVIRDTHERRSSYYHCSDVKDLTYRSFMDIDHMFNDIYDNTGIDIEDEIRRGRVYCENPAVLDYFMNYYQKLHNPGLAFYF